MRKPAATPVDEYAGSPASSRAASARVREAFESRSREAPVRTSNEDEAREAEAPVAPQPTTPAQAAAAVVEQAPAPDAPQPTTPAQVVVELTPPVAPAAAAPGVLAQASVLRPL